MNHNDTFVSRLQCLYWQAACNLTGGRDGQTGKKTLNFYINVNGKTIGKSPSSYGINISLFETYVGGQNNDNESFEDESDQTTVVSNRAEIKGECLSYFQIITKAPDYFKTKVIERLLQNSNLPLPFCNITLYIIK